MFPYKKRWDAPRRLEEGCRVRIVPEPYVEHGCCMIMTRSMGEVFYWVLETSFPEGGSLSLSHVICMFSMLDDMVRYG